MEPIDLSPKPKLFVATDLIETAKELQTDLAGMHPEVQGEFAVHAINALGDPSDINGVTKLFLHACGAIVLSDALTTASTDYEWANGKYYIDAFVKARFNRFAFVHYESFNSLSLQLLDAQILAEEADEMSLGVASLRYMKMYVPVHSVESVLAA